MQKRVINLAVVNTKTSALWKEYAATHSMEARNELLMNYIHLVKSIVRRMVPTYKNYVEYDDLMSCGVIGLMDAIDKFDIKKEVKFETYASLRIKGEIIDQIRKQNWAPISLRQKVKRIESAFTEVSNKIGRQATEREVADYMKMPIEEVQKMLDESHTFNMVCLDEIIVDRVKSDEYLESSEYSPEQQYEDRELKQIVVNFIDNLSDKEKLVITLYYFEELTLKEIGLTLGISESRVSQIHSKALLTLRTWVKAFVR